MQLDTLENFRRVAARQIADQRGAGPARAPVAFALSGKGPGKVGRDPALRGPRQCQGRSALGLNVFISISLKEQAKDSMAKFERRIAEHEEVMECYPMTGDSDYLIRVAVADIGALEKFILNQLTPIPGARPVRIGLRCRRRSGHSFRF
jgi:DNA-binding Lrp family transcriptional regulator